MHFERNTLGVRCCACLAVLVIALWALASTDPAMASGTWTLAWEENFDDGCANGWTLTCCTRSDVICVQPTGQSQALYGRSPAPEVLPSKRPGLPGPIHTHGGFTASSPDLRALGVDFRYPYTIEFRYRIPNNEDVRWSYVLASRPALLVIEDTVDGVARLGLLDTNHANFQHVADLAVGGDWVDIKVRADPSPMAGLCNYKLFVDGDLVSAGTREDCLQYPGVQVMDLPHRIAHEPVEPGTAGATYGAGWWDDFKVRTFLPDERTRDSRDLDIDVGPSPFNPRTTIKCAMPEPGRLHVTIFDVAGRMVRVLCDEQRPAGLQVLEWNGRDDRGADVASGSYLVRVQTDGGQAVARAVLVR